MELTKDIYKNNTGTPELDAYEQELLRLEGFKLGKILIEKGLINREQLEHGLSIQKEEGGRLGWILLNLGYINRLQFFEAQAQKNGKTFCFTTY